MDSVVQVSKKTILACTFDLYDVHPPISTDSRCLIVCSCANLLMLMCFVILCSIVKLPGFPDLGPASDIPDSPSRTHLSVTNYNPTPIFDRCQGSILHFLNNSEFKNADLLAAVQSLTSISKDQRDKCLSHQLNPDICEHSYIFIHGYHHSGTSTIHDALPHLFEDVSILSHKLTKSQLRHQLEGQWMTSVYPTFFKVGRDACIDYKYSISVPRNISRGAAKLFEDWKDHWDLNKCALVEKDPSFQTIDLKEQFFPHVGSHIFVMRHPYSIMCSYNERDMCENAQSCLHYFVNRWNDILSRMQRGLRAAIVCFEGFLEDHTYSNRRELGYHGNIKEVQISRKYMWKDSTKRILQDCKKKKQCRKFVQERNTLSPFCGYDLMESRINFQRSNNSVVVTSDNKKKVGALLEALNKIEVLGFPS